MTLPRWRLQGGEDVAALEIVASVLQGRVGGQRAGFGGREGEVGGFDGVALAEDHQALHQILELPHVARPAVGLEGAHGPG